MSFLRIVLDPLSSITQLPENISNKISPLLRDHSGVAKEGISLFTIAPQFFKGFLEGRSWVSLSHVGHKKYNFFSTVSNLCGFVASASETLHVVTKFQYPDVRIQNKHNLASIFATAALIGWTGKNLLTVGLSFVDVVSYHPINNVDKKEVQMSRARASLIQSTISTLACGLQVAVQFNLTKKSQASDVIKVASLVVNFAAYMWTQGKVSEYTPNPYRFLNKT